jgi:predicted NBD/HSP70 family sugar kinase
MRADYISHIGQHSKRLVVDRLLDRSPATAEELAKATGVSERAIESLAAALAHDGWVRQADLPNAGIDNSTKTYELVAEAAYSFGVDLGGTKIAAAIADFTGRIVAELTEPTNARGERHVVDQICALASKLRPNEIARGCGIQSVLVGAPGAVHPTTARISLAPNIDGLSHVDLLQSLKEQFGPVVAIENDANLAMLGEAFEGCARRHRNAAFLALGTGVGLGLIIDGNLVRGASGAAGEIAYLPIGSDTTSAAALAIGAFELEVGSLGIVQRYRVAGGLASITTVREIFSQLDTGDTIAAKVLDGAARSVALACTSLQSILDLEIIVLGGGIGAHAEFVSRVQSTMSTVFARPVTLVASALGTRAGVVGAVRGAVKQLHGHYFGLSTVMQ